MKPKAFSYLRMSTDEQLKGDSRRRQLEASKAYAEEHGLELADNAQLEDIGISAFKGANVRVGALGKFLAAVTDGSVHSGSYLLVESLDRLSREELLAAHTLFLSIVQAGIVLVTLDDRQVYRAGNLDVVKLITSLVRQERAHEESKLKSARVGAAWKNKRAKAAEGQPMTARCPAWLRLAPDRKSYELIPDRVEIVRQIFADSAAGLGMYSIARRLNAAGVPAFVGKQGWHRSYLAKTLENRAVLGEIQPHVKVEGKRVAQGEPIENYYPAIVSRELFYQAEQSRTQRKNGGSGRKGPGYTNLFTGIARCAYCHSTIVFENKGPGKGGGTYLVCGSAQRGRSCDATRWKYLDFEASFLAFVQELDLDSIINAGQDAEKRKELEAEIAATKGEISSVAGLMEKTYAVLQAGGSPEFIAGKLNELTAKKAQLQSRLIAKASQQREFADRESRFERSREEIKDLVGRLQFPPSEELYKLRAQIASRLKVLVETLLIAPKGSLPIMNHSIEELTKMAGEKAQDVITQMQQLAAQPEQSRRYFAVGFRDAAVRAVFPANDDPLRFELQIVADQSASVDPKRFIDRIEPSGKRTSMT
jgi:DNA invertase Pin-like site-specific DNA recombinase